MLFLLVFSLNSFLLHSHLCGQELAKKVKKLYISFTLYCSVIPGFGFFQKAS